MPAHSAHTTFGFASLVVVRQSVVCALAGDYSHVEPFGLHVHEYTAPGFDAPESETPDCLCGHGTATALVDSAGHPRTDDTDDTSLS